jgi:hypothetical protein
VELGDEGEVAAERRRVGLRGQRFHEDAAGDPVLDARLQPDLQRAEGLVRLVVPSSAMISAGVGTFSRNATESTPRMSIALAAT